MLANLIVERSISTSLYSSRNGREIFPIYSTIRNAIPSSIVHLSNNPISITHSLDLFVKSEYRKSYETLHRKLFGLGEDVSDEAMWYNGRSTYVLIPQSINLKHQERENLKNIEESIIET